MKLRGGLLGVKRGTNARYPLTEALSKIFPPPLIHKPGERRKKVPKDESSVYSTKRDARIEVVSEQLCGMFTPLKIWKCRMETNEY